MPASATVGNPNPLTDVQYLPWDKYDPSDPTTTSLSTRRGRCCSIRSSGGRSSTRRSSSCSSTGRRRCRWTSSISSASSRRATRRASRSSRRRRSRTAIRDRDRVRGEELRAGVDQRDLDGQVDRLAHDPVRELARADGLRRPGHGADRGARLRDRRVGQPGAQPSQAAQDAATMLKSFTSNIDVVRQLTLFYGYGPL